MILNIDGNINRYYAQTLCMIFFPGATFPENEEPGTDVAEVDIKIENDGERTVTAFAKIKLNDKLCESKESVSDPEITGERLTKIAVGRALYAAGKSMFGHIPPWGILTGVRPSKIASELLYQGKGIIRSKRILRDEYFVNPQKAALAVSVASTEWKITKKVPRDSCSLYIAIPFCPSRCSYCSFVSYTSNKLLSLIDDYLEMLIKDLRNITDIIKETGSKLLTVYIGGGTPTVLNESQLERLLSEINSCVDVSSLAEFTMEAGRPDTITMEKLATAKKYGVTRISVNPQTLSDDILKEIGRRHTVEDFFNAYRIAEESGIRDINIDLIAGLPGDDFKNFSSTVDRIIELAPSNITVHTFCVKKAADVLKNNKDVYSIYGGDAAKCVEYSQIKTKFAGYKPYYMYRQKNTVGNLENVGYSREGHEGLYNILMMEEIHSIFAVGAGAVTKLVKYTGAGINDRRIERIFTPKYPYEYLREADAIRLGDEESGRKPIRERIFEFYGKGR